MPVSTRTRPDVVSMSRQLSAWSSRRLSSTSSATRPPHRTHGTGPKRVPASERKVPAWTSATRTPPPSSADQSTASFSAMPAPGQSGALRLLLGVPARLEVPMVRRGSRLGLALVLRSELRRAVGPLDGTRHPEEADLAAPHAVIQRDRQVGHIRKLEREVALPARVHVPGRGVNEEPEPPQGAVV